MTLSVKWEMHQEIEVEDTEKKVERCLAFLYILPVVNEDCNVSRVFRKGTHTADLILVFGSNHPSLAEVLLWYSLNKRQSQTFLIRTWD